MHNIQKYNNHIHNIHSLSLYCFLTSHASNGRGKASSGQLWDLRDRSTSNRKIRIKTTTKIVTIILN